MKGHKGRARAEVEPVENDWLYTCPRGLPTPEIAAALKVVGQPITEVLAHIWQEDWQMANSFMDAYNYPATYRFPPGGPVYWSALKDWILVKRSQVERTSRGRIANVRFVGELVIVRASWEAAVNTLAFLLDVVQAHVNWSQKQYHAQARIVLVLEGWDRPVVTGRIGKRVAWTVNPLPQPPTA